MQVFYDTAELKFPSNSVVTIGTFDGVHLAHQKILKSVTTAAKQAGGQSIVITFWPHPKTVLTDGKEIPLLLSTQEEKINLLEQNNIDILLILPFTKEFSLWGAEKFLKELLIEKIHAKKIVLGYDHHFGNKREGNIQYLKEKQAALGFDLEEISKQLIEDAAISSTNIRKAIYEGDCTLAQKLLGRPYSFTGTIIKGNQLGRTIGFPTANIHINEEYKLIPKNGVYAVEVELHDKHIHTSPHNRYFKGMLNIGHRPTVNGKNLSIEVNIFDFDEDIYGERLTVKLIERLRDEQKFNGLEGLMAQLKTDKENTLTIFQIR